MIKEDMKKKHDKMFKECIDLMREPISKMGDKYPLEIINASLIELGLRMSMIQGGTYHTIRVFANIMDNLATFGQMIERDLQTMIEEGREPNAFDDWKYSNSTKKKTIH
jgi:hypothetical protein|tara:strand:+ start:2376 stop:2702 length:327 start_codon:yes stop_codon:yes gene_type:complete